MVGRRPVHLILMSCLVIYLMLVGTTNLFAATTEVNLGKVSVSKLDDLVNSNIKMLQSGGECIYIVDYIPDKAATVYLRNVVIMDSKTIANINEAMNIANKQFKDKPEYFKSGTYYSRRNNAFRYYVGKADAAITTKAEYNKFLAGYAQKKPEKLVLKLSDYESNAKYPNEANFGFKGSYKHIDVPILGGTVIRTITQDTAAEAPVSKEYTVANYEELENAFADGIKNFYEKIIVRSPVKFDSDFSARIDKKAQEFPEGALFKTYAYSARDLMKGSNRFEYVVKLYYNYKPDQCKKLFAESSSRADEIISELIKPGMSDYKKILAIHDYVCLITVYDWDVWKFALHSERPDSTNYSGPLLGGTANCAGYSRAMQLLLNKAGFECLYVTGKVDSIFASTNIWQGHAWNIVKLNGNYYHIDATSNDNEMNLKSRDGRWYDYFDLTGGKNANYAHYLFDDASMSKDHEWDKTAYPPCNDSKMWYLSQMKEYLFLLTWVVKYFWLPIILFVIIMCFIQWKTGGYKRMKEERERRKKMRYAKKHKGEVLDQPGSSSSSNSNIFCTQCGKSVDSESKYCKECGALVKGK